MNVDLRFPNISATTHEGQMSQMQSYLHQLVEQLNWALNSLDEAVAGIYYAVYTTPASKYKTVTLIRNIIVLREEA